jgi:hypothetical protein
MLSSRHPFSFERLDKSWLDAKDTTPEAGLGYRSVAGGIHFLSAPGRVLAPDGRVVVSGLVGFFLA